MATITHRPYETEAQYLYERRRGAIERMSKRERAATPLPFRDMLIAIARSARVR